MRSARSELSARSGRGEDKERGRRLGRRGERTGTETWTARGERTETGTRNGAQWQTARGERTETGTRNGARRAKRGQGQVLEFF